MAPEKGARGPRQHEERKHQQSTAGQLSMGRGLPASQGRMPARAQPRGAARGRGGVQSEPVRPPRAAAAWPASSCRTRSSCAGAGGRPCRSRAGPEASRMCPA
eukprot:6973841-Alexandrium_andersonii.AAC.1